MHYEPFSNGVTTGRCCKMTGTSLNTSNLYYVIKWYLSTEDSTICELMWCLMGGYSHVKTYGDVPPKRVSFHQKSLDKAPILVKKKILTIGFYITKIAKNWGRKTLRNWSRFAKIVKNTVKSAIFEGEKSLGMGKGFRLHTDQKIIWVPHLEGLIIQSFSLSFNV